MDADWRIGTTSAPVLSDRVAIVTGSCGTYGGAVAYAFAAAGATTVLTDLDLGRLEAAQRDIRALLESADTDVVPADLTRDEDIDSLVDGVRNRHGRIDALVHCAAKLGGHYFLDYDRSEIDHTLRLNLRSALILCQAVAREMAAGPGGSMVLIGSVGSLRAHEHAVVYDACKGALDAAARAMAVDLAPQQIRVNVVAPPRPLDGELPLSDVSSTRIALGSPGILRRDLANACVFFASPMSEHITGQVLAVDNGLTATLRWPEHGLVPRE